VDCGRETSDTEPSSVVLPGNRPTRLAGKASPLAVAVLLLAYPLFEARLLLLPRLATPPTRLCVRFLLLTPVQDDCPMTLEGRGLLAGRGVKRSSPAGLVDNR
jgi:hypothetical protein